MSDRREDLARQIRKALGMYNDPNLPVVTCVKSVADELRDLTMVLLRGPQDGLTEETQSTLLSRALDYVEDFGYGHQSKLTRSEINDVKDAVARDDSLTYEEAEALIIKLRLELIADIKKALGKDD